MVNLKKCSCLMWLCFIVLAAKVAAKPAAAPNASESALEEHLNNEIEAGESENQTSNEDSEFNKKYAQMMKTYMNESVDPCDNFYEYACGNWANVIEERQTHHKRSNLLDIIYKLGDVVDKLLLKSPASLEQRYASEYKLAQQFYQSCLSADLFPMKKSQAYLEVINSIGGFPALDDNWKAENFSWFNMSAHMTNYGADGLVNEEILPQHPFSPYFKLPELGFDLLVHSDNIATNTSRGYTLNEKRMREYLTTYGVEQERATQIIANIFEFWRAVLKLNDEFNDDLDTCIQLSTTFKTETFKDWQNYFEIAWRGKDFQVKEDDCPCDYLYVQLDEICRNHTEAVANYLALKFLYQMDARLEHTKFQKEYCTMKLQYALPYLIDKLYFNELFNEEIHNEITTLVQEIRKSLRTILEEADWLDETTRAEALSKESTVVSRIGNFDDPIMSERLIRDMKNLEFTENNYELNNLNLRKFQTLQKRYNGLHSEQLDNSTKPLELLVGMQVNAFYYNIDNSINVMAGILHPPAYHKAWPSSLKFGTLGYLIGHEFTHGFDTVGAMFDSAGGERYWWSKKSSKIFRQRANCYANHFNNYLIPEINRKVNGNQTMDENIADSGGLRESLIAYRRYMKELSKQPEQSALLKQQQMPGLDLSPEQLFFLGFAQIWCGAYKEEHFWEELSNEHTMDRYRVLGALTNFDEFAKVYNCPLGSKMNPNVEKCRVW